MIDKAHDAKRWDKAMRVARAKEMRAVEAGLIAQNRELHLQQLSLYFQLFVIKFRKVVRQIFIHKPRMVLIKLSIFRLKVMLLLIDGTLSLNKLYDKLKTHKRSNVVAAESPTFQLTCGGQKLGSATVLTVKCAGAVPSASASDA